MSFAMPTGRVLSIEFPESGAIRTRRVVTRSRARPTGKYPSLKMGRSVQYESPNERNAFRLLDADPSVLTYREQPAAINYVLNGDTRTHHPDILVERVNSLEFWEVKTAKDASKPDVQRRTDLLERTLPAFGYTYRVVLAEDLHREPRLTNVKTLLRLGRQPVSPLAREQLRRLLDVSGCIRWGDVINGALGPAGCQLVCRLVLEGMLVFDVENQLDEETAVVLADQES